MSIKKNSLALFLVFFSSSTAFSIENKNTKECSAYGSTYIALPSVNSCVNFQGSFIFDAFEKIKPYSENKKKKFDGPFFGTSLRLQSSIRSETKLGDFLGYLSLNFGFEPRYGEEGMSDIEKEKKFNGSIYIEELWVQLGGLRMGRAYSPFVEFSGFAGALIKDSKIGYGPTSPANLISYTYDTQSPFSFVFAVENHASQNYDVFSIVGGVKYTSGLFILTGVVGLDTNAGEFTPKIRLDVPITNNLSLFAMGAYGNTENINLYKIWKGKLALWGGGTFKSSENVAINFQGAYSQGDLIEQKNTRQSDYSFGANVDYEFSKNFHLIPELNYTFTTDKKSDVVDAQVRFKRSF